MEAVMQRFVVSIQRLGRGGFYMTGGISPPARFTKLYGRDQQRAWPLIQIEPVGAWPAIGAGCAGMAVRS